MRHTFACSCHIQCSSTPGRDTDCTVFEFLRKFSLLMLLFVVALSTYLSMQNTTDWREPLWVRIHPLNGDGLESTSNYINGLTESDFDAIEEFIKREAARYSVNIQEPVRVLLGSEIRDVPPEPPRGANPFSIAYWSLKLRWWAYSVTRNEPGPRADIHLFLIYFDPDYRTTVAHSLGLQKGLIGIVNVFAAPAQAAQNIFVAAHEMLHTLGATDKYAPPKFLPVYPDGYADPERTPRYPQSAAEIMGGRIPLSENHAEMPASLLQAQIGSATAVEIRWIR
jgi:hypothetical protein